MKLDLRKKSIIDSKYSSLYKNIFNENKKNFDNLIANISYLHKDNLDWWFSHTSSRNLIDYPLYRQERKHYNYRV